METSITNVLKKVLKPGRYTGGEFSQVIKDKKDVDVRVAFCFPDTYEIGMSNLGVRILYGVLNEEPRVWCERVYAPWVDMEEEMRKNGIPLFAHESRDPVSEFDIVAFSLQYELCYSNVLNMLELAGIPMLASERGEDAPVVVGGGPCAYNAEPVADFFDAFSIGEGEEALPEMTRLYSEMKKDGTYTKKDFLRRLSHIPGFYVPSLYDVLYKEDGTIKSCLPKYPDVPEKVIKRIIRDMDQSYYPEKPVVPYIETVHDRIVLEVYRGCIRGCRFCQAGMVFRPVREKSPETLDRQAKCVYENSGYDEVSLSSLSISDYSRLPELTDRLLSWTEPAMVNLSLPSMRIDSFSKELMEKVSSVRSAGITFAPEAGTQRLRDAINKNVTEEDLMRSCRIAFETGKNAVKLYFMDGLPTETVEDVEGIADLASKVVTEYFHTEGRNKSRAPQISISVSVFIPKPFTAFQWDAQDDLDTVMMKQRRLREKLDGKKHIRYSWHDAEVSRIEAVFARGNRRLSSALIEAHRLGVKFDSWDEHFSYEKWLRAFEISGIDPSFYANREFGEDEVLPWDVIDCGVSKSFLLRERHKAYESKTTPPCSEKCSGCGADNLGGKTRWCPHRTE